METVTVNVLNGHVKTFEPRPVDIELKSLTDNVRTTQTAYTANRVVGNMSVIDWNGFKRRWPHLLKINFPRTANRPIVNVLIGLDCAELHFAITEIKGKSGEPIARLTPIGWTCIGIPNMNCREVLKTNFTYFVSDQPQIERLTGSVKQLCETEDVSLMLESPVVRIEEILTLKSHEKSITYGPGHAKTCLMPYANNKGADQPAHHRNLISAFIVRSLDNITSLVSRSEISRF